MTDEQPIPAPEPAPAPTLQVKVSPDRKSIAVRTGFEDDSPGPVKAWQSVTPLPVSMVGWLSEADVADWTPVGLPE